jgi:hypothetical protein
MKSLNFVDYIPGIMALILGVMYSGTSRMLGVSEAVSEVLDFAVVVVVIVVVVEVVVVALVAGV